MSSDMITPLSVATSEDLFIDHIRDIASELSCEEKEESIENYLSALSMAADRELSMTETFEVRNFGESFLNGGFSNQTELVESYFNLINLLSLESVMSQTCSGEWIGAPGFLSLCDQQEEIEGLPGACSYQCVDPYTAQDCTLYFLCTPE